MGYDWGVKMRQHTKRAFTLVELMLVVVILGVLVAMVVPRLTGRSEQARKAAAKTDIESNISLALDMYELDNGSYPESLEALLVKPSSGSENWSGPYLKKKPIDPWGREYQFKSPGVHNKDYDLYSLGSDGAEGGGDDITNWQ
jgi:general secretion pathway protein G